MPHLQHSENCRYPKHHKEGTKQSRHVKKHAVHGEKEKEYSPYQFKTAEHPQHIAEQKEMGKGKKDEQAQWMFHAPQKERPRSPKEQNNNINRREPESGAKCRYSHLVSSFSEL